MNKNAIIAALVALIIGIGIGFFMGQTSGGGNVQPSASTAAQEAQASAAPSSASGQTTQQAQQDSQAAQGQQNSQDRQDVEERQDQQGSQDKQDTQDQQSQQSEQDTQDQQYQQYQQDSYTQQDQQTSSAPEQSSREDVQEQTDEQDTWGESYVYVEEDGTYTSKDEVAAYIHQFGHLPSNYISKSKARKAGWESKEGNLDEVLPGMSIGGSEFYNDEGLLPDAPGRTWTECDINYEGGYRGAERIVFSNDGLIFYTADHYESFEQLY